MRQPPSILYKYRSFDQIIRLLTDKTVAFSAPNQFNDPFDCHIEISHSFSSDLYDDKLSDRMIEDAFGPTIPKAPQNYLDNLQRLKNRRIHDPNEDLHRYVKDIINREKIQNSKGPAEELNNLWVQSMRDLRVFCVAENFNNLLMWGHYTNNHEGVVIGFKSDIIWPVNSVVNLLPVQYEDEFPLFGTEDEWVDVFSRGTMPDINRDIRRFLSIKSKDWLYEKEWRFFYVLPQGTGQQSKVSIVDIPNDGVVSLHLGVKLSPSQRQQVVQLAHTTFPNASIQVASKNASRFSLDFT